MKRIFASLFVIVAILGIGVFTTGAYFSSTVSTSNQVFRTGTTGLVFGQCGLIGADCHAVVADKTALDMSGIEQNTGPGIQNSGCMVIENKGIYDLTLSTTISYTTSKPDFAWFFELAAQQATDHCNPTGALLDWTRAQTAQGNSPIAFGTLAPGARLYVVLYNRWDSTGDQNYLQGQWLILNLQLEGRTV
jgi:hypothetical protein